MKKCKKLLDKMKAHKRIKTQFRKVGDMNHRYRTRST